MAGIFNTVKAIPAIKAMPYSWNKQYLADTLIHLFNLEPDNSYEVRYNP